MVADPRNAASANAIEKLIANLDESGRRDFVAFTLVQRRPRLHRLFVTASRRADLARIPEQAKVLSMYSKLLKRRGHEDEELCQNAAKAAGRIPRILDDLVARGLVSKPTLRVSRPQFEAARASRGALLAARLTAEDIGRWKASAIVLEATVIASANAATVISTAHTIDARASSRAGMAMAATSSLVALDTTQDEHHKWLKRRLSRGQERRATSIIQRLTSVLMPRRSLPPEQREAVLAYLNTESQLAAFQDLHAGLYNDILTKYGGAITPRDAALVEIVPAARGLSQMAAKLVERHSALAVPDEASACYFRWQETYLAYEEWTSAALSAYKGLLVGAEPHVQRVETLFAQQSELSGRAQSEQAKLIRSLGLKPDDIRQLLNQARIAAAAEDWPAS